MKVLKITSQFKKDLKRIQNRPTTLQHLENALILLRDGTTLPAKYKAHPLAGNYKGCLECHVENDSLLIWMDENNDVIKLLRFGSHSELF